MDVLVFIIITIVIISFINSLQVRVKLKGECHLLHFNIENSGQLRSAGNCGFGHIY